MLRENNTNEGIIREYQNHNITLKLSREALEQIALHDNTIETISYLFESLDCYLINEGCAGNDEMYILIYNAYSDKIYLLLEYREITEKLKKGLQVRLYARTPDNSDRETIDNYFEGGY